MWKIKVLCLFFLCFTWFAKSSVAAYDKDPIQATQSDAVPVTEELLTREGQTGPASPSFKMPDTAGFLVKKTYQEAEEVKDADDSEDVSSSDLWDDWFTLEEDKESKSVSQPIGKE